MSRAFVKDDSDSPEPVVPRAISEAPNYVTPRGLKLLRDALQAAEGVADTREADYYRARIDSAIVVPKPERNETSIQIGATVVAHADDGTRLRTKIVGEDEADPVNGSISWNSPIARAFTGHASGEEIAVQRPAGPISYAIDSVLYD